MSDYFYNYWYLYDKLSFIFFCLSICLIIYFCLSNRSSLKHSESSLILFKQFFTGSEFCKVWSLKRHYTHRSFLSFSEYRDRKSSCFKHFRGFPCSNCSMIVSILSRIFQLNFKLFGFWGWGWTWGWAWGWCVGVSINFSKTLFFTQFNLFGIIL